MTVGAIGSLALPRVRRAWLIGAQVLPLRVKPVRDVLGLGLGHTSRESFALTTYLGALSWLQRLSA